MRTLRTVALLSALAPVSSLIAQDVQFVGAQACAACHLEQFESQSRSAHAEALNPVDEHPLAHAFAAARARDGEWVYQLQEDPEGLTVQVGSDEAMRSRRIGWAFGSGYQAVTFVSHLNEDEYLEHHLSYYTGPERLGLTPGHHEQPIETVEQALGVRYDTLSAGAEIMRCFRCHSTGPLDLNEEFAIRPSELGVRCEACHGPGSEHIARIETTDIDAARAAIANPSRLDARELMTYCGSCHRPPSSDGEAVDYRDPWNVRHQPIYLSRSPCFTESPAGLTCMNCHDPHEPIRRDDPGYYNARCLGCHSAEQSPPAATCQAEPGCASCHMPGVQPQSELTFHNHWIGIYGESDPLVPRDTDASARRTSATNGSSGP